MAFLKDFIYFFFVLSGNYNWLYFIVFASVTFTSVSLDHAEPTISTLEIVGDTCCKSTLARTPHALQTRVTRSNVLHNRFLNITQHKKGRERNVFSLAPWAFRSPHRRMSPMILNKYRLVTACFTSN